MKQRQRFESLDSFRGVCALMVAFMHLPADHHLYFTPMVRHSYLFVDFFFVLSGWVISYAYLDRLKSGEDMRDFVVRRFGRVWPLHVAVLAVLVLVQLAALVAQSTGGVEMPKPAFTGNWDASAIPLHLLLIQAIHSGRDGTWNLPSWSISVEFWTYIIFALLVFVTPRRRIIPAAAVLSVGGLLVVLAVSPRFMDTTFDYGIYRCFGGFFAGVIAQMVWSKSDHVLNRAIWTLLEIAVLALGIGFVVVTGETNWAILAPLMFVPTIYVFAHEGGYVSDFMRLRWLKLLGLWSFSIYMIHSLYALIVFRNVPRILEKLTDVSLVKRVTLNDQNLVLLSFQNQWLTDLAAVIYLALVIATAALSYRFIEVPARDWFYRLSARRKTSSVPPPSVALEEAAQ